MPVLRRNPKEKSYHVGKVRMRLTDNHVNFRLHERAKSEIAPDGFRGSKPFFVRKNKQGNYYALLKLYMSGLKTNRMHELMHVLQVALHDSAGIRLNPYSVLGQFEEEIIFPLLESRKIFDAHHRLRQIDSLDDLVEAKEHIKSQKTVSDRYLKIFLPTLFKSRHQFTEAIVHLFSNSRMRRALVRMNNTDRGPYVSREARLIGLLFVNEAIRQRKEKEKSKR